MDKKYIIYKHTAPNDKVYIGQTCQDPNKRFGRNGYGYRGSTLFYNAIQKYGWDNIKHEILFEGLTKEEANKIETELIYKYHSNEKEFGYNLQSGGNTYYMSEETKKKMSEAKIGKKDSDETRKRKSEGHKGKHFSEDTKNKLSLKGKQRTDIFTNGRKLGLANKGRKHTEESKKHMSESHNVINKRKVLCVESNTVYNSVTEASINTGVHRQNISKACSGKLKTAGKFHWEYIS